MGYDQQYPLMTHYVQTNLQSTQVQVLNFKLLNLNSSSVAPD